MRVTPVGVDDDVKARTRTAVAEAVGGSAARLRTVSAPALIGLLAASAFAPLAVGSVSGMITAGVAVLGSVGANVLTDVVTGAVGRLRPDAVADSAAISQVRQALADRVEAAFASSGPADEQVRGEVIALFEAYDIAGTALHTAATLDDAELLPRMVSAFADLTAVFGDFGFVLVNTRLDVQILHQDLRREIARQSADRERFRQAEADLGRLLDAVRDLRASEPFAAGAGGLDGSPRWDGCPYLGLMPFEERHTTIFYGRRTLTRGLANRLSEQLTRGGILLVIGPSGAGKSSLLRAGLLASVANGQLVPGSRTWPRRALTPTANPLEHLATHLADLSGTDAPSIYESLTAHPERAYLLAAQAVTSASCEGGEPSRLVLVIDQLEELFTLCADPQEQELFLTALHAMATTAVGAGGLPAALVVASIRGDFLDQATAFAPLARAAEAGVFTVGTMTESELAEAITGPAAEANIPVPDELTTAILDDLRDRSLTVGFDCGALPLLSQVMFTMWQADDSHRLTVAGYRRTGGIAGIVQTSAENAYLALTESRRDLARRVFIHLTATTDGRLTRHPATHAALRTAAGCAESDLDAVLDAFTGQRLITRTDGDTVSIAHEELLRSWTRLHGWLQPSITDQALHRALIEDVQAWLTHHQDLSYLYLGSQLHAVQDAATRWTTDPAQSLVVDIDTQTFLSASKRHSRRRRRLYQTLASAMTILVVVAIGAAVLATRNATLAERNAYRVEQQHAVALSRQLAAQSQALSPTEWGVGQRLAAAALRTSPTNEAAIAASARLAHYRDTFAYPGQAMAVAFSPDGRLLAIAGNAQVWLWHIAPGLPVGAPLAGLAHAPPASNPDEIVNAVAFSPDGKVLASGTGDGVVRLWSAVTGEQIGAPLAGNLGSVEAVAFSPDGTILVAAGSSALRSWNPATGRPIRTLSGYADAVAFSPDGKLLAASVGSAVWLWNPATGRRAGTFRASRGLVQAVAFSPDGKLLASGGGNDRMVRLWNLATGRQVGAPLAGHTGAVEGVAFSPDGTMLASVDDDNTVLLWNPATRKQIDVSLTGHTYVVSSVAFSPDGRSLATASWDGTVRLWNPFTGRPLGDPVVSQSGSQGVAFSPDGTLLALGADDERARLWNVATGRQIGGPIDMQSNRASAVAFSPDGGLLATTSFDEVRLWSPSTGLPIGAPLALKPRAMLDGNGIDVVNAIAFSPDGSLLASGSDDGMVRLWNPATGRLNGAPLTGHTGPVTGLAFSLDGTVLATASADKTLRLWSPTTGQQVAGPYMGNAEVYAVAFSPDGKMLASGGADEMVRLWDPTTGRQVSAPLAGHTGSVRAVAFSPDGSSLASTSEDETTRLWDPATGRQVGVPLTGHTFTVWSVAFSPDSKMLATSSYDETVRLWNPAIYEDPIRRLCDQAGEIAPDEWSTYATGEQPTKVCL